MPMEKTKINTLNKLIDSGINTEKKISALGIQEIIAVPRITVPEIHIITEIQDAVKARAVIAYLADADDEAAEKDAKRKPEKSAADEGKDNAGKDNIPDPAAANADSSNPGTAEAAHPHSADNGSSAYTNESEVRKHDRFRF